MINVDLTFSESINRKLQRCSMIFNCRLVVVPLTAWVVLSAVTFMEPLDAAEPVVVAESSSADYPQQPQLVIDRTGIIHLAYGAQNDVLYARSSDGGQSFTRPVLVGNAGQLSLGMRRGPRISATADALCISVIGGKQGKGRDGDILLFRSADDGKTWDTPVTVNDAMGSAREGLHAMAASSSGELSCVWLDLRHDKTEIFASTSTDGGKNWSKNVLVYSSPSGSVCECCHPSATYSASGQLHVMWRNSWEGKRDMFHTMSADGGKTFARGQKLGSGSWSLDHCPMDGGSLGLLSNGKPAAVWRRDKTVFYAGSKSSDETSIGSGEQPWLTVSAIGPIVLWLQKRPGSLLLRQPGQSQPSEIAKSARDPVIASGGAKNDIVVAAWEEANGKGKRIICQRIELNH